MANIKPPYPIDVRDTLRQLADRIVITRKAFGWRQIDLANHSGVSRSTLVEVEKGSPHVSMGNYMSILWALNSLGDMGKIMPIESDSHRLMASQLPQRVRNG